jgi:hypothetical protein
MFSVYFARQGFVSIEALPKRELMDCLCEFENSIPVRGQGEDFAERMLTFNCDRATKKQYLAFARESQGC